MPRPLSRLLLAAALAAGGLAWWYLERPEPVPVVVAKVDRGPVERIVANTRAGTVKACRRSRLAPATGGQVSALPVREGDRVKAGQPLLEIWNEDLKARVDLAEAEAEAARARLRETCLRADVAARDAERLRRLGERKLVAEEQVDQATTNAEALRAACNAALASLQVAVARIKVARATLARTLLEAPFPGVVAEVNAELGEFVTPSPPGIPTPPAIDLIDDTCLFASAPIDEVDAPLVRPGMPACLSLDALPERLCGARVRRIAPYALDREREARTVDIESDFPGARAPEGVLPGLSVDIEVTIERRDDAVRIPTEAVLEGHRVLVFDPGTGRLEARTFRAGLENWRYTEVLEGLAPGDQVVISLDREGVEAGRAAVVESVRAPGDGADGTGGRTP